MWTLIDSIRLRSHKGRSDDHSLAEENNCYTQMMAEERVTPRFGHGGSGEKPEVVGMLIKDIGAVY